MTAPTTPTGSLLRRRVVTGLVLAPPAPRDGAASDGSTGRRADILRDRCAGELAARELVRHLDACDRRDGHPVVPAPRSAAVQRWFHATTAQQHVGALLGDLPAGWHVLHAVPVHGPGLAGTGVDHLVLGPAGVLVLRTAHHDGERVRVHREQVRADGRPVGHVREVGRQVEVVSARLGPSAGHDVAVAAVVVLVGARSLQACDVPRPVTVLTERQLLAWLAQRPRRLSQVVVDRLAAAAADPRTWGLPLAPGEADEATRRVREQACVATLRAATRPVGVRALLRGRPRDGR